MSLVASSVDEALAFVGPVLDQVPCQVHGIGADTPPAPPCLLVQWPSCEPVGMLDCPEWSWEVPILLVGATTQATGLADLQRQTQVALYRAGLRSRAEPRNYNRPNDPAPLPAVLITAY